MKYEYQILRRHDIENRRFEEGGNPATKDIMRTDSIKSRLNELGKQGWRLLFIEEVSSYCGEDDRFYFERERKSEFIMEGGAE